MKIETKVLIVGPNGTTVEAVAREIERGWDVALTVPHRGDTKVVLKRRTHWWSRFLPDYVPVVAKTTAGTAIYKS